MFLPKIVFPILFVASRQHFFVLLPEDKSTSLYLYQLRAHSYDRAKRDPLATLMPKESTSLCSLSREKTKLV